MAHVILGLLLIYPQSLYDLIKSFEAGVSLFYSASTGSIKRALDKLLAEGLIEVATTELGARGRKVYQVTAAGRVEFRAWMTGEPSGNTETAALARLYFLGLLDAVDRPPVLRRITHRIGTDLAQLTTLREHLRTVDVPEELREVGASQAATLDYGIAAHEHALAWFTDYLETIDTEGG